MTNVIFYALPPARYGLGIYRAGALNDRFGSAVVALDRPILPWNKTNWPAFKTQRNGCKYWFPTARLESVIHTLSNHNAVDERTSAREST